VRWSGLSDWRLEVELAKLGLTIRDLECDVRDVPEFKPWIETLSPDAWRRLALEHFGDQGNPQPRERSEWHLWGYTPDWPGGRLPPLDDDEAPAEAPPGNDRYGKDYPGAPVEEVVRLAHAAQLEGRNLGRTLRDELARNVSGATTYEVDAIFRLMRRDLLADAGRKGWLKVAGRLSATPPFINLRELETRS
jgi:hypothetical protein